MKFINKIPLTEKKLVIGLVASFVMLFMLYGYLVNATIVNIVEREHFEEEMGELIAEVGMLEGEYGTLRSSITYQGAQMLGFQEPSRQVFASQRQLVGNLFAR
jgi:hypothetical protein